MHPNVHQKALTVMFTAVLLVQQGKERHDIQESRNTADKENRIPRTRAKKNPRRPVAQWAQQTPAQGKGQGRSPKGHLQRKNGTNGLFDVNHLEENCTEILHYGMLGCVQRKNYQ